MVSWTKSVRDILPKFIVEDMTNQVRINLFRLKRSSKSHRSKAT